MSVRFVALAAALLAASPTSAEVFSFNFSGAFNSGPLTGQTSSGTVTYDTSIALTSSFGNIFSYNSAVFSNVTGIATNGSASVVVTDNSSSGQPNYIAFKAGSLQLTFSGPATIIPGSGQPTLTQLSLLTASLYNQGSNSFGPLTITSNVSSAVPEPATWGMMIAGFGIVGGAMRYRRRSAKVMCA